MGRAVNFIGRAFAAFLALLQPQTPAPVLSAPVVLPGTSFMDRRRFAAQVHHKSAKNPNGFPTRARKAESCIAIVLHQTACIMGERPERFDGGGAHFFVTRAGRVIWLHGFDRIVAAANGWNAGSVSIEVDGLYDGDERHPAWDNPATSIHEKGVALTPEATKATLQLIAWIRVQCPTVREILAHRQSSAERADDPGQALWRDIALMCGLPTVPNAVVTGGSPIPESWDPAQVGVKY